MHFFVHKQYNALKNNTENREVLLIHSLKSGSHTAFDEIYRLYAKRLYAYSLQFTKSPEESEEIVQDVFLKLWINREKIRQEETLRSLLFIMAKHYLINAYRTKIKEPAYEEYVHYKDALPAGDASFQMEYHDFLDQVYKTINTLPTTQKRVILLSKFKQYTNKEIAAKLSLSEQTVKNQLSIGLKALREKLGVLYFIYMLLFFN